MTTGSTPNYDFFLGDDNTLMNNPDLVLGNNWTKMQGVPRQPVFAQLPNTYDITTYKHGMRIYRQGYQSTFICLGSNPDWGIFWRPVQAKYGPWVNIPNTVLKNTTNYVIGSQPLQYRISNDGRFLMRGSISRVSGAFPDYESTTTALDLLKNISNTEGFQVYPAMRGQFQLGCQPQNAAPTKPHMGIFSMEIDGSSSLRIFNADNVVTQVFFNSVSWDIKSGLGYPES